MNVTELTESLKAIINEYDRTFAEQMAALPKDAKTERKALHLQRGMCRYVRAHALLADVPRFLDAHRLRLSKALSDDNEDLRLYSSLPEEDKDVCAVYLDTVAAIRIDCIARMEKELALAKEYSDSEAVFGLEIRLRTLEKLLTSLQEWWAEHGCARFDAWEG